MRVDRERLCDPPLGFLFFPTRGLFKTFIVFVYILAVCTNYIFTEYVPYNMHMVVILNSLSECLRADMRALTLPQGNDEKGKRFFILYSVHAIWFSLFLWIIGMPLTRFRNAQCVFCYHAKTFSILSKTRRVTPRVYL